MSVVLLDTHALLWWALDPDQLSPKATRAITAMEKTGGLASSISIWELGVKVQRGKLTLPLSIDKLGGVLKSPPPKPDHFDRLR
jgi:PIN domain nuclease of toxin-antitoxin system